MAASQMARRKWGEPRLDIRLRVPANWPDSRTVASRASKGNVLTGTGESVNLAGLANDGRSQYSPDAGNRLDHMINTFRQGLGLIHGS